MSTLTTTVNTSEIASLATGFLGKSAEVKEVVRKAIQQAPTVATAVIVAGEFAIEDAMTDKDKAFITKAIKRGRILVEGGATPPDDKCYAVIAQAESRGFDICTDQYSIWSNGKIYIKENGFRKLFEMREDCSELDTSIQPPQWMKLQDRSCWHVPVRAWVTVKGRGKVTVDCTVGVNGNLSDGINKIEAHAERSVLRKLWKKVTSISMDEDEGDDTVPGSVIVVDEPNAKIESSPIEVHITETKDYHVYGENDPRAGSFGSFNRLMSITKGDPSEQKAMRDFWHAIKMAKSLDELDAVGAEIKSAQVGKDARTILQQWWLSCQKVLKTEGGAA